jgi:hypothetical protein
MDKEPTSGIERAVFGAVGRDDIDAWLSRHERHWRPHVDPQTVSAHLQARLGGDLAHILFRSGRIAAVYGAALRDGRQVAVKVHRRVAAVAYLSAAAACQRRLAEVGYPCPAPLDGPATTDGLTAVIETLCSDGQPGNSHEPTTRRAMAHALVEQLELLRGAAVDGLVAGAPAWAHYEHATPPTVLDRARPSGLVHVWPTRHRIRAVRNGLQRYVIRAGRTCDPGNQARVEIPDKDEVPGSGPGSPFRQRAGCRV